MAGESDLLCDNRFADGAIIASSTAAGSSAANLIDWRTATVWTSSNTTTQTLTVDCGSAKSADGAGLGGHNLASVGASVAFQGSSDNFVGDITVAYAAAPVLKNGVLFVAFPTQTKRYWRVVITNLTAPCTIAIASIGVRFVFEVPIHGEYTPAVERVHGQVDLPATGQMLEDLPAYIELSSQVVFNRVTDVWYRTLFMPLWNRWLMKSKPFFWSPDRDTRPADVYVMWVTPGSVLDAGFIPFTWLRKFSLSLRGVKL